VPSTITAARLCSALPSKGGAAVSVAKEPDWWPRDPFDYMFLGRVVEKIGAAMHSDWTGKETSTKDIEPLPDSPKDATYFDQKKADILLSQFRADLGNLDFLAGRDARKFSDKDWKTAVDRAQRLFEQRQPALFRLHATQSEIVRRNKARELELKITKNDGLWCNFQADWWSISRWRSHFDCCRINPEYPNGDRPSWKEDNDHWIFATLQSVESVESLLKRLAQKKSQSHGKPASDAEFTDFVKKFGGPWTESALATAAKNAGMSVTRARVRAALPDRRRGRPNKSPK
jgi:hypothetical protein